jgi:hypothetical protein
VTSNAPAKPAAAAKTLSAPAQQPALLASHGRDTPEAR